MWSPLCALLFTPNVLVSAGLVPLGLRIGPLVGLGGIELQQDGGLEKRDDICGDGWSLCGADCCPQGGLCTAGICWWTCSLEDPGIIPCGYFSCCLADYQVCNNGLCVYTVVPTGPSLEQATPTPDPVPSCGGGWAACGPTGCCPAVATATCVSTPDFGCGWTCNPGDTPCGSNSCCMSDYQLCDNGQCVFTVLPGQVPQPTISIPPPIITSSPNPIPTTTPTITPSPMPNPNPTTIPIPPPTYYIFTSNPTPTPNTIPIQLVGDSSTALSSGSSTIAASTSTSTTATATAQDSGFNSWSRAERAGLILGIIASAIGIATFIRCAFNGWKM